MLVFRNEFSRDGISRTALAIFVSHGGVSRIWVSALDHEAVDDSVEEKAVIESCQSKFLEIGPVLRSFAVKLHFDSTETGDDIEHRLLREPRHEISCCFLFFDHFDLF